MNTGVSVDISANSAPLLKAFADIKAAAKAAAGDMQKAMAAAKVPAPDIAAHLNLQKQQVFKTNEAILGNTKATVAKLKALLDQEAAAYQAAAVNKFRPPDITRTPLSGARPPGSSGPGQWDHLEGTAFQGGRRPPGSTPGSGRSNMYGLGVAYNAVQDVMQGGLPAIANNIPQIIQLVAQSPALKMLGAAAFAAASTFFAYKMYKDNTGQEEAAFTRYAINKAKADKKARATYLSDGIEKATAAGASQGETSIALGQASAAAEATANRRAAFVQDQIAAERELRRARIDAIVDPAARAIALANEEKAAIQEKADTAKRLSDENFQRAQKELNESAQRVNDLKTQIAALNAGQLTPAAVIQRASLQAALPGALTRSKNAQERLDNARSSATDLSLSDTSVTQKATIDARLQSTLATQGRQNLNDFFASLTRGMASLAQIGKAYADQAEKLRQQEKQKAEINTNRQIAQLRGSGRDRQANKLQRQQDETTTAAQYEKQGYTSEDAQRMAGEDMDLRDRAANPRRIRGAGRKGSPRPDRASGLDYFRTGKMQGPTTSALDDYEQRRNIPGVGHKVDHDLAAKQAKEDTARAAAAPQGDTTTHTLLQKVIGLLSSIGTLPSKA